MRALRDRLSGLSCIAASLVVACSVFPDEAVLPAQSGGSGTGNEGGLPAAEGGAGSGTGATAGEPGVLPLGGSPASGGSSGSGSGGTSAGGESAGQAGGGGAVTQTCVSPKEYSDFTTLDLWIGSADKSANHGQDAVLYVSGGADERRAMFSLTLPAAPTGAVLIRAEVVLHLESNADTSRAARRLGLYPQTPLRAVVEGKANWNQFGPSKSQHAWDTAGGGGDLGELIATADIAASTSSGLVRFDVTEAVSVLLDTTTQVYGVVILEEGTAPAAPAALAFTSREGNASVSPSLLLRYCQP